MNLNKSTWGYFFLTLPFLLSSCGGSNDDPTPPGPEPPGPATDGSISLTLDAGSGKPGALAYYFYGTDGQLTQGPLSCDGQGNYKKDKFAIGTYRVLAVSASRPGVDLRDMDKHSAASACLSALVTNRSTGLTMVSQPGNVYSAVVKDEVKVSAEASASHTPRVSLLTQTLELPITLKNGLGGEVTAISGILQGVSPSVNLLTGAPVSSVDACANTAVSFTAGGEGSARTASISLFGICDPAGGEAYTNTLNLTLTMSDGSTEDLAVDLTDVLTDALSGGSFPSGGLDLPVEVSRVSMQLGAKVTGWSAGGETSRDMEN